MGAAPTIFAAIEEASLSLGLDIDETIVALAVIVAVSPRRELFRNVLAEIEKSRATAIAFAMHPEPGGDTVQ